MRPMNNVGKLTLSEIWILVKSGCAALIACTIIFVVPYLLLYSGMDVAEKVGGKKWVGPLNIIIYVGIIWFLLSHVSSLLLGVDESLVRAGNRLKSMPSWKRIVISLLFLSYFIGWLKLPTATFFLSVLVLIPAEFVYGKYKQLMNSKGSVDPVDA